MARFCGNKHTKRAIAAVTFVMVFVPYGFFLAYHFRFFVRKKLLALAVVISVVGFATLVLFIANTLSDPGFVKSVGKPYRAFDVLKDRFRTTAPPRYIDMTINGMPVKIKYCRTCHIYRPPRTVHCSECDKCILRFDHHCPYVYNCIGLYNYRLFLGFLLAGSVYYLLLLGAFIYRAVDFFPNFPGNAAEHTGDIVGTIVCMVVVLVSILLVVGLCCFHGLIITENMSTYEKVKERFVEFNPFHRGLFRNWKAVIAYCPRRAPHNNTAYNPKAMYDIHDKPPSLNQTQ